MERLRGPAQPLPEGRRADRDDHELLEIGRVDRVLAAVEDVDQRHRHDPRAGTAEVSVKRKPDRLGRGVGRRQADAEEGVRSEPRLVRRSVQVDQQTVEADLVDGVDAKQLGAERLVDVADRGEDALSAIALRVAVAHLHRLVRAGRGSRRDDGRAHRSVVQEEIDLDRRIAARVEDLPSDDILDQRGHRSSAG